MRIFQYYQTNNNLLNIVIWKYFFNRFRHKNTKNLRTAQGCKMSSPAKGDSQLSGWQIASSQDSFCDFGRKLESLCMPVHNTVLCCHGRQAQVLMCPDGTFRTHTSLRLNLNQAYLDFLIFGQRNKTVPA